MPTPATRTLVSLAAATTLTLALGACAPHWSTAHPAAAPEASIAMRFDNEAQTAVHVYLVGDRREWLLGRVEPGARATLRVPAASLDESAGFVRLAVLAGGASLQAARDPRTTFTIAQPAGSLLGQRWTFARRQLAAPELIGMRANVGRL